MLKREVQDTRRAITRGLWLIPESFPERVMFKLNKVRFIGISFCLQKGRGSMFSVTGIAHAKAIVQ